MMNVCHQCGLRRVDKIIDPSGRYAICPECGFQHPFLRLPLFVVSGASTAGKSTLLYRLVGRLDEFVLLDSDILWRPEFDHPENQYRDFFETWLCMCKNISQSGRPVMIFGAGFGVPENIEPCVERRYFSRVHYLALTCEEEALRERLKSRPDWRGCNIPEFIQSQVQFNQWFIDQGKREQPIIEILDTTSAAVDQTAEAVAAWAKGRYAACTYQYS